MKNLNKLMAIPASLVLLFSSFTSSYASSTMTLEDEYRDGNKKVCVYSDGRNSDQVRKSLAGSCPSKHISHDDDE